MAFNFPWTNFHELNLDWFLSKFKQFTANYLGTTATVQIIPDTEQPEVTVTGGTLDDDTDIVDPFTFNFKLPISQSGGAVDSVNGQTGIVVLDKTDIGLGNVANVAQYSASNPPPYPVTSVNGMTGAVSIPATVIDASPTQNSTNAVSSGGVWTDINLISNNFAWVETTYTASRAYTKGDFITVNGRLCEVTANIALGATLTENTNYKVLSGNGGYGDIIAKLVANGFNVYTYNVTTYSSADYRQSIIDNINDIEAQKPCIIFPRADRRVMVIGNKFLNNTAIFLMLSPDNTEWLRCTGGVWKYLDVAINTNH